MLFNSISFLFFLPVVFALYWLVNDKGLKVQHLLLLAASYFFYACWDWRFLFLLAFSTGLDYYTGLKIAGSGQAGHRRFWFWLSILVNLGFLGFFKYYNFFATSFSGLLGGLGLHSSPWVLQIILPVGISFYTFHGLSYVIDIYKRRIEPERDFVTYALFVSYFPLLVAGPIERATHLLPQLKRQRTFNYAQAADGLRQILWGLFKKVVIADQCAIYANLIFNNSSAYSGSTLVVGAVLFAFQIYGDFSGYSDIALGVSRLFGIELLRNFAYPYFSRDIAEFWRRWHISLSSWFRDYLYIPLGGSQGGMWKKVRNTFIIFIVSGFWHGANWTFIAWGALNALYFLPTILLGTNRRHLNIVAEGKRLPSWRELLSMLLTFGLTVFAWIFFRASDLSHAFRYIKQICSASLFSVPALKPSVVFSWILVMLIIEWRGRNEKYALATIDIYRSRPLRWAAYYVLICSIWYFSGTKQQFIYFQF